MKRHLIVIRVLQALIGIQLLAGVLSIFTLSIGRAIAVFGSAGLIYLGINIVQQLTSIRELLSYSAVKMSFPDKEFSAVQATQEPAIHMSNNKDSRGSEAAYAAPGRFAVTSDEV